MREIIRNPIDWLIKAIGALTAFAFVTSGIANSVLFSDLWGINYLLVANTSDIVMSAFGFATVFAISSIAAVSIMWVAKRAVGWALEAAATFVERKTGRPLGKSKSKSHRIAVPALTLLMTLLFAFMMVGVGVERGRPIWYETGLKTKADQKFGEMACGSRRVAWLGSSAAVIECPGSPLIIHNLDDLQTVPLDPGRTSYLGIQPDERARPVPFWVRGARTSEG